MIPKINNTHGPETRNIINRVIEVLNQQGKSLQDLVAEGQLTPEQYATLIQVVNGLISKGNVSPLDIDKNLGKFDSTYFTNEFLDDLNNGTVNATKILPLSITSGDLTKGAVTPEKTSFFNTSTNLFNKDNIELARTIEADGTEVDSELFWLSKDFIPVDYGDVLSFSDNLGYNINTRIITYDADKQFISRSSTTDDKYTINAHSVKFIRLSGTAHPDDLMVNRGETLLSYEEFYHTIHHNFIPDLSLKERTVTPDKTTFFNISDNLFNVENVLANRSINTDGNIVDDPVRWLNTDYIPVRQGATVYIHSDNAGFFRVALYTLDKSFISRSGTTDQAIEITSSVARFIRISGDNVIGADSVMVTINQEKPFQPYGEEKIDKQYLPTNIQIDLEAIKEEVEQIVLDNEEALNPYPPRLSLTKIHDGSSAPYTMSKDGQTIYGRTGSTRLVLSRDEWETFETIATMPTFINMVRELDDGELLVSCNRNEGEGLKAKVYKSQGFDKFNPDNTEFIEVLETGSSLANITNHWGISIYNEIVVLSEYGLKGVDGANYVYYSDDYGNTFTEIFDLKNANVDGMPTWNDSAHLHTVCYDPYYNRIWLCTGDGDNTAVYYTDDRVNWHFVEGSNVVQYTGIIALEDAVVFGSDRNPNGLHIYRRKQKGDMPKIVTWYKLNDHPSLTHVFGLPYRRTHDKNTPVYFPAQTTINMGTSVVMGFADSKKAHLLYETDAVHSFGDGAGIDAVLGDTAQGNVLVSVAEPDGKRVVYKSPSPVWE